MLLEATRGRLTATGQRARWTGVNLSPSVKTLPPPVNVAGAAIRYQREMEESQMLLLSPYRIALFVHVVSAVLLLGGSVFAAYTRAAIREAETAGALRRWLAFARRSSRLNSLAAPALLLTGIYLGWDGDFRQPWFIVGVAAWAVNAVVAVRGVEGQLHRIASAIASLPDVPVGAAVEELRWSRRWDAAADTVLANDLAILYVMMNGSGAAECVTALALSNALVHGIAAMWRRRAPAIAFQATARTLSPDEQ